MLRQVRARKELESCRFLKTELGKGEVWVCCVLCIETLSSVFFSLFFLPF